MQFPTQYLDWSQPALPTAAEVLLRRYDRSRRVCDLSHVLVVFPGKQSGRRFQEILTQQTEGRLIPPTIITVGRLPEYLYELKKPFASPLTQSLAWAEALKSLPRNRLSAVIPQPPDDSDMDAWIRLGEMLSRQHRELAADVLSFSNVAEKGATLEGFNEFERWSVLADVQQIYLDQLLAEQLWDQQTARLFAIEHQECRTDRDIALIGTVDLNRTLQAMLEQVNDHVSVFIHAPESKADAFGRYGNLLSRRWVEEPIEIDDERIRIVDDPQGQSHAVLEALAKCCEAFSIEDITIGVPDDRIIPSLRRRLTEHGVQSNWLIHQSLPQTSPYRLLESIAESLFADRTDHFSKLIRHPHLSRWIDRQLRSSQWLTSWDTYVTDHLQRRTQARIGNSRHDKAAHRLIEIVSRLLKPLQGSVRPLDDWAGPIRDLLLEVYDDLPLNLEHDDDRSVSDACRLIVESCLEHARIPESLRPVVTGQQAIRLVLSQLRGEFIASTPTANSVHLSGWLDLPLDDAPVAIVTSFNEGLIPSAVNHDLFLPNRLRQHLKIEDNERRYARDAYALSVLLNSRESLQLISARRDANGEPLSPSRLLFAMAPEQIARRIVRFYESEESSAKGQAAQESDRNWPQQHRFIIPRPQVQPSRKTTFRVTEFRDYLASPYRYYLRHILGLQPLTDAVVELDPAGFGSLIHDVLQQFGLSQQAHQQDAKSIQRFLNQSLEKLVRKRYGHDPLFPVHVQVEQIRHRLEVFARWQANWAQQGYQIKFTEIGMGKQIDFPLDDGRTVTIRGRIDRVDYHSERDEWVIFDYKTSDSAKSPEQTHRSKGEWIDLQLPLYRHLAKPYGVQGDVRLGYITIPRTTTQIHEQLADWTDAELAAADRVAQDVAQRVLNEEFWQELDRPVAGYREFSRICQDGVFDQQVLV